MNPLISRLPNHLQDIVQALCLKRGGMHLTNHYLQKGKKKYLYCGNPGQHLNHVIPDYHHQGANGHHELLSVLSEEGTDYMLFQPRRLSLILLRKKCLANPNEGIVYKIIVLLKNVNVVKHRQRTCSRWKETENTWQPHAIHDPKLDALPERKGTKCVKKNRDDWQNYSVNWELDKNVIWWSLNMITKKIFLAANTHGTTQG